MRRFLKAVAAFVLLVGVAWGALAFRLSQGPLSVDFLTGTLERALSVDDAVVTVGSTSLTWRGFGEPFVFEMNRMQVARPDKTPVLTVERIGVRLSKRALLAGRIEPRTILIYGSALRVLRGEDGRFTLNLDTSVEAQENPVPATAPAAAPAAAPDAVPAPPANAGQSAFIEDFLGQLGRREGPRFLRRLARVSVIDAALLYEDKRLGLRLNSGATQIDLRRTDDGLTATALMRVDLDETHTADLRASFVHEWESKRSVAALTFADVVPALVARQGGALQALSGLEAPFSGTAALQFDGNFKPGSGKLALSAGAGSIAVPGLYDTPVAIKDFSLRLRFSAPTVEFILDDLSADLDVPAPPVTGDPRITATGGLVRGADGRTLTLDATLRGLPLDALAAWWPATLAVDARKWVTEHLSAGTATRATIGASLDFPALCGDACAQPWNDFGKPVLRKVGGQIDFTGVKVDYFPPLMPVLDVDGSAAYDEKSFNLSMTSGALGDMRVTGSKIAITGLDTQDATTHAKIDIHVDLEGPLKTALKLLDSEPLGYPKQLGLKPAAVEGNAKLGVNFRFPLYEKLQLGEVQVSADAALSDIALPGVVSGMALSGGPFDLSLKDGTLGIKGKGKLADMPVTFDWMKTFAGKGNVDSHLKASLPLGAKALATFGAPPDLQLSGTVPAAVEYTTLRDGTAALVFKGDLEQAGFTLPVIAARKEPSTPGTLGFTAAFNKGGALTGFSGIDLATAAATVKGSVGLASDGRTVNSAALEQLRAGDTNVRVMAARRPGGDGYDINVSGPQLDLSPVFAEEPTPGGAPAAAPSEKSLPLNITMAVDKLMTGKDAAIAQVRLFVRRNAYRRIDEARLDAVSGGRPVLLRYDIVPQGHSLRFEAYNAGAVLKTLGISNSVRGGRILVQGLPNVRDPGKRNLHGTVSMTDFSLVGVPALGRLLGALSLGGFTELLGGKGLSFKKLRASFVWIDRGLPETQQDVRRIQLSDGQTSGAALGLTFEGAIDKLSNTLDLRGTIIPVNDLNKLVGAIPLVGDILTGGGKGVFAATYTMKGPADTADVRVNPLAALAPGILRKVFFEK